MKKAHIVAIVLVLVAIAVAGVYLGYTRGLFGRATGAVAQAVPVSSDEVSANQLALGTLALEGTDMAVTPDQATELLPLWQMLNALYGSNNAAQAEIDAVVGQLRKTMTVDQMEAIQSAGASPEQMAAVMESLGMETIQRPAAQGTPAADRMQGGFQGQPPAALEGGPQRFAGEFPGGAVPRGELSFSEADVAAMRATREAGGGDAGPMMEGRLNTAVVERLIEILQARAAG